MDNNYHTFLAISPKTSHSPWQPLKELVTGLKIVDFFFSIERKKVKASPKGKG
jgi:hypothetical protein